MANIEELIQLADDISMELERVNGMMEPYEYESYYVDNLDRAYELLSEVKDLIEA